ncbi:hypothetical protein [Halorubrum sp. Ib24]|uniref:hypothetical protein n=1 Tax=Halorubrum sp. Ib24 TaxID=1383850 RepID=UPI00374365E3
MYECSAISRGGYSRIAAEPAPVGRCSRCMTMLSKIEPLHVTMSCAWPARLHRRALLAACRRVDVARAVPALPVVRRFALVVGEAARLGVRVADVAAV